MGIELDGKRGVMNHYGPRKSGAPNVGGQTGVFNTKFAEWVFDHDDLPTPLGTNDMQYIIPTGSLIVGATWKNITAGLGGSGTYAVGLNGTNNETVDVNGLFEVGEITDAVRKAAPTAVASGFFTIGAADGELKVTQSVDDLTAGQARVLVEYITAS